MGEAAADPEAESVGVATGGEALAASEAADGAASGAVAAAEDWGWGDWAASGVVGEAVDLAAAAKLLAHTWCR